MKHIGLILLVVGIGLSAAFGSKNPESIHQQNIDSGRAAFLGDLETDAFDAYCAFLLDGELTLQDGCVDPDAEPEADGESEGEAEEGEAEEGEAEEGEEQAEEVAAPTLEELVEQHRAEIAQMRAGPVTGLPAGAVELRDAWIAARELSVEPRAAAAVGAQTTPAPGARFASWFSGSGIPFVLGLLLVVVGAVLSRKASHADESGGADEDGKPIDFGVLLTALVADVSMLADDASRQTTPTHADFENFKGRVDLIKLEKVDRLVSAHRNVERKYGLATYAAIFSPFSGGERSLNRSWAALSDRHWPEALSSMQKAAAHFAAAQAEVPGDAVQGEG